MTKDDVHHVALSAESPEAGRSSTAAHTPGPWFIAGTTHIYASGERGANICLVSEPRATQEVKYTELEIGSRDFAEACANARLIRAAPKMLAALNRALSLLLIDGEPPSLVTIEGTEAQSVIETYEAISAAIQATRVAP